MSIQDLKENHKDLYWDLVRLLQDMKNGGGSARWILNIYGTDDVDFRNIEKMLYHLNIATDILQGTLYRK